MKKIYYDLDTRSFLDETKLKLAKWMSKMYFCNVYTALKLMLPYSQDKLKEKNIGILITDHNVDETLSITDRAYLLFDGKILFQGTSEELAQNPIVKEKYLGKDFELKRRMPGKEA